MQKKKKIAARILSVMLSVVIICTMMPATIFAEEGADACSDVNGENTADEFEVTETEKEEYREIIVGSGGTDGYTTSDGDTLQKAINDIMYGGTVKLNEEMFLKNQEFKVDEDKGIVLDLNSNKITASFDIVKNSSFISNYGNLTIIDSATGGAINVEVINTHWYDSYLCGIVNYGEGNLTINSGTIELTNNSPLTNGIAIWNMGEGEIKMSGGKVSSSSYGKSGTITMNRGTLTIIDGIVENTADRKQGYAVYVSPSAKYSRIGGEIIGKESMQEPAYSVEGTIKGSDINAGIAATLTLKNKNSETVGNIIKANTDGTYIFPEIPLGYGYTILVECYGYTTGIITEFDIVDGNITGKDLILHKMTNKTLYVDSTFIGSENDGSENNPYTTVQKAIDSAADGDTIKLLSNIKDEIVTIGDISLNFDQNDFLVACVNSTKPLITYNGTSGKRLTIQNTGSARTASLWDSYTTIPLIRNNGTGTIQISGIDIHNNASNGVCISNESTGEIKILSGMVRALGTSGYAIKNSGGGKVTITGGNVGPAVSMNGNKLQNTANPPDDLELYTLTFSDLTSKQNIEKLTIGIGENLYDYGVEGVVVDRYNNKLYAYLPAGLEIADVSAVAGGVNYTGNIENHAATLTIDSDSTEKHVIIDELGGIGAIGAGRYKPGTYVTLTAGTKSGYIFSHWILNGVQNYHEFGEKVMFTMPDNAVKATIKWSEDKKAGDNNIPFVPAAKECSTAATVDKNGKASVAITTGNISDAINAAKDAASKKDGEVTAVINITTGGEDVNAVAIHLSKMVQSDIINKEIADVVFVIKNAGITIGFECYNRNK